MLTAPDDHHDRHLRQCCELAAIRAKQDAEYEPRPSAGEAGLRRSLRQAVSIEIRHMPRGGRPIAQHAINAIRHARREHSASISREHA